MLNKMFAAMLCLLMLGSVAAAQVKTIKLKDGGVVTGTVKKTKDGYEVTKKNGIVAVVLADQVKTIEDTSAPEDEYLEKLKTIDPNDADERFKLGEWAFQNGLYRIAESELQTAKKLRKDFEKADLLLRQVQAQMKGSPSSSDLPKPKPVDPKAPRKTKDNLVSPRDINRIRLSEIRRGEQMRIMFRNKALDRFIKSMSATDDFRDNPNFEKSFRRLAPHAQLDYILDHVDRGAWAIKDDIVLRGDPKVFMEFRRKVWPLINQGCGSINCHGAAEGKGKLKIYPLSASNDAAVYTNFMALDMFKKGGIKIIYRDNPDMSLLLDYGLPLKDAKSKHPGKVPSIYKSVNDPKYKIVKDWISSLQGPPHPRYDTDYKPSHERKSPTTKPAAATTKPTARPADKTLK